jgi:hypothetical protein
MADAGTGAGGRDTERLIRAALLTLSLVLLEALVRLVILGPRMSWSERSLDAFVPSVAGSRSSAGPGRSFASGSSTGSASPPWP